MARVLPGLPAKNEETAAQLASLTFMLPMVSHTYVPTEGMPGRLRFLADWNPISSVVAACRDLFGNAPAAAGDAAWPLQHRVAATLLRSAVLLALLIPLSVRRSACGRP